MPLVVRVRALTPPLGRTGGDHPATPIPHPRMSTEPTPSTRDATRQRDRPTDRRRDRPRAGAPAATRADTWTAAETDDPFATARAPRTFDPRCTRRLRNCCDGHNAAQLDGN